MVAVKGAVGKNRNRIRQVDRPPGPRRRIVDEVHERGVEGGAPRQPHGPPAVRAEASFEGEVDEDEAAAQRNIKVPQADARCAVECGPPPRHPNDCQVAAARERHPAGVGASEAGLREVQHPPGGRGGDEEVHGGVGAEDVLRRVAGHDHKVPGGAHPARLAHAPGAHERPPPARRVALGVRVNGSQEKDEEEEEQAALAHRHHHTAGFFGELRSQPKDI
mmetsp:Transcript_23635/g.56654  ORF Transcript_23635/g.56654 Transcript_23635/m.56654 type:complete len:220 (+) Transcript_23635:261-920(+)